VKTLWLDFIKGFIPKSRTLRHFLTFLPDAYLATKIPDMSGKNLTYGNTSYRLYGLSAFSNRHAVLQKLEMWQQKWKFGTVVNISLT